MATEEFLTRTTDHVSMVEHFDSKISRPTTMTPEKVKWMDNVLEAQHALLSETEPITAVFALKWGGLLEKDDTCIQPC
jgi:hypothetical protein